MESEKAVKRLSDADLVDKLIWVTATMERESCGSMENAMLFEDCKGEVLRRLQERLHARYEKQWTSSGEMKKRE